MKVPVFILLILSVCAGCSDKPAPVAAPIQRFLLFQGNYEESDIGGKYPNGASLTVHSIFKIDTVTGQVWKYYLSTVESSNKITSMEGWQEIKDKSKDVFNTK